MIDRILEKFGDHGAESSRRDEFQKHYAAHWCIEMLCDDSINEVICEYGEDIVVTRNKSYELHQVKTRQESMSDWQLNDLIHVFAKSFAMTPYFGNVTKCCFISNEGAKGTLLELKTRLSKGYGLWDTEDKIWFDDFCRNYAKKILEEIQSLDSENTFTIDDVKKAILSLDISTDFHHMKYIQDSNIRRLRQVIENDISNGRGMIFSDDEIDDIYEGLMGLIGKATIGIDRKEKTLSKEIIFDNLKKAVVSRKTQYRFPTQEEIAAAPGDTKLEQKLSLGGFTPEFISTAREVMVEALHTARSWDFGLSESIFEDIRFRMKYYCIDSYDKICQAHPTKERIGRLILDDLKKEFPSLIEYYKTSRIPVDDIFLLGTTWLLTSECKAYWSQYRLE